MTFPAQPRFPAQENEPQEESMTRINRRPSRDTNEAIERLLSLAGISCEAGWSYDEIAYKIDQAREQMEELYGRTDPAPPSEPMVEYMGQ